MEPSAERGLGLVKDGSGSRRNLETAPRAGEFLSCGKPMEAAGFAAFASASVGEPLVKQVLQAGIVIRKLLVKIFDRIFHFHAINLPKSLGHPQSNQKIYEKCNQLRAVTG